MFFIRRSVTCISGRVVECQTGDCEVSGSNLTGGYVTCTNANSACHPSGLWVGYEYQRQLGSKRAYHAMHYPRIRGLAVSACVRLRANETEKSRRSAPPFTLVFLLATKL